MKDIELINLNINAKQAYLLMILKHISSPLAFDVHPHRPKYHDAHLGIKFS